MEPIIEALPFWNNAHFVLFLWSVLCFICGILVAGLLYYYHIHYVIKKADSYIEWLRHHNSEHERRYGVNDRRDQ